MDLHRARRALAALVSLAVVAVALPACGNRENDRGNPGGGSQTPGAKTGTNPAQASPTSDTPPSAPY